MRKSKQLRTARGAGIIISFGLMWSLQPSAFADSPFLKQGITEFNAGNFSEASGHLGAALSTDFNNSVLHYYLGNCYVHMKQREAAIREFRIAYALDPEKDVGKLSKQALAGLNADAPAGTTSSASSAPSTVTDAAARAAVDKLLDLKAKPGGWTPTGHEGTTTQGVPSPAGLPIGLTPGIDQSRALTPLPAGQKVEVGRGGRLIEPPPTSKTPPQSTATSGDTAARQQLESLRRLYEGNRYVPTNRTNQEIQKTADNLRELMSQQAKPGSHHLVPGGTNVYIRNYQTQPNEGAQPPPTQPANTPPKKTP